MNTLRNRVQLIGNLGTAPEIKNLEGGKKMAKLVIATSETFKNQKGEFRFSLLESVGQACYDITVDKEAVEESFMFYKERME